jgi:hypothetical protein
VPFKHGEKLPPHITEALTALVTSPGSPVNTIVEGMEILYAGLRQSKEFPDELAHVLGNLAHQVVTYQWHGKTDRAYGIYAFCLQALNEAKAETPEPDKRYEKAHPPIVEGDPSASAPAPTPGPVAPDGVPVPAVVVPAPAPAEAATTSTQ